MRWHHKDTSSQSAWYVAREYLNRVPAQGDFRISLDEPRAIGGSGAESKPGSCMIRSPSSPVDLSDGGQVERAQWCFSR